MIDQHKPYNSRIAVPAFFFPFLSPKSDNAGDEDIDHLYHKLMERCPTSKRALIYIHIPFCDSLCHFCAFYRIRTPGVDVIEKYIEVLKKEIKVYAQMPYVKSLKIESIYFGGGSPSVLSPKHIDKLLSWTRECFNPEHGTELNFEGEIRTLKDKERLKVIHDNEWNRISFGVQTFNPDVRKRVGIVASLNDIRECIENTQDMGYNINIDLMYGLPGQTMSVWEKDLFQSINIGAANIDIYDTILYPNSKIFRLSSKFESEFPSEETRIEMLIYAMTYLKESGYSQDTIEDFSLPDREYKMKKLLYGGSDGMAEMIGIGVNSIGFLNNTAYRNFSPLQDYIKWPSAKKLPIRLTYDATLEDLSTRMMVYLPKLIKMKKDDFKPDFMVKYKNIIDHLKDNDLIEETNSVIKLTDLGILWADNISMEFLTKKQKNKMWEVIY